MKLLQFDGKDAHPVDAGEHVEQDGGISARSVVSVIVMVGIVALITLGLRTFVFVPYEIPSGSMEETIMTGDMVFSEKVSYYVRTPQRGDIVTFDDPEVAGRTLIKRVIAVGGQTVNLVDGSVYVDGVKLDEPYTNGKESRPLARTAPGANISFPYKVPQGEIWVMGDNRTQSQDSRYFGSIPVSSVTGRGALIYWPLKDIKLLS